MFRNLQMASSMRISWDKPWDTWCKRMQKREMMTNEMEWGLPQTTPDDFWRIPCFPCWKWSASSSPQPFSWSFLGSSIWYPQRLHNYGKITIFFNGYGISTSSLSHWPFFITSVKSPGGSPCPSIFFWTALRAKPWPIGSLQRSRGKYGSCLFKHKAIGDHESTILL